MSIETCQSSGLQTSAGIAIVARPCKIHGITMLQAAAATVGVVYDSAAATGTAVLKATTTINASTTTVMLSIPAECLNGAYVATTGVGASFILYYSLL